jgi:hypothetical protein
MDAGVQAPQQISTASNVRPGPFGLDKVNIEELHQHTLALGCTFLYVLLFLWSYLCNESSI